MNILLLRPHPGNEQFGLGHNVTNTNLRFRAWKGGPT